MTIGHERVPLGGPAAWIGRDLERDGSWVWHLDGAALAAIDAALAAVRRAGLRWQDLTPERFPIGDFAETMAALGEALEHGRGIVVLRGLPVKDYDAEALQCIHYGLALHLGTPVYQSARGELIGAITDEGAAALERGTLAAKGGDTPFLSSRARVQTTGPLRFHTDRTDVVTLLCAEPAAAGGLSQIASAVTIHDTMLARRPDLLEQLFLDLPRSRLGEGIPRWPGLLHAAGLRLGGRAPHHPLLAHLCGGGTAGGSRAAGHPGAVGSPRSAAGAGLRALPDAPHAGRRHPVSQQPHHVPRPHRL